MTWGHLVRLRWTERRSITWLNLSSAPLTSGLGLVRLPLNIISCVGHTDLYSITQGGRAFLMDPHVNHPLPGPGPAKKRKRIPGLPRHWDEPEQQSSALPYDDDAADMATEENGAVEDVEEEEESRELTHNEIWDDSALIAAWESATAEYEVSC